jgi:prepilin peptidase CpaA
VEGGVRPASTQRIAGVTSLVQAPNIAIVAAAGLAGTLIDLRLRRVPNALTLGVALLGLALAGLHSSGVGVASALLGLTLALALMLPGHLLGATGGGDVKLFAATGTLLGPELVMAAFLYTLLAGGALALTVAVRRRLAGASLRRLAGIVRRDRAGAAGIEEAPADSRFAYAPAIAVGTLVAALGW